MQWLNLLILFFAFGLPAITWAISKIKEQMEIKRAKEAEQRRREEMLRTGRVEVDEPQVAAVETAQQARARELRELAAKRQAQIRRIREQQRQQQQGQKPQPTPPRTRTAGQGGAAQPRPGVPYQKPPARPQAPAAPTPLKIDPQATPAYIPLAERSRERSEARRRELEERRARRIAEQDLRLGRRRTVATPAVPISTPQLRVSRREMRRAVVLAEVLGTPVSMREDV